MRAAEERTVILGGPVRLEDLVAVARYNARVEFSEEYRERVRRCRAHVDQFSREGKAIYGLTTGLGANWKKFVPEHDREIIQKNHIRAHAAGVGDLLPEECVRAMMFVMLVHFGTGYTGIRLEVLEQIQGLLNAGVTPRVPGHGSVGYLCQEAHIGRVLIGEGRAWYKGEWLNGAEALIAAERKPLTLSSKEGLTLVSGTTAVTALAALAFYDAVTLARTADVAGALSLEVLQGTLMAMDPRIMAQRPHMDQGYTAENLRKILADSPLLERCKGNRVQDCLSLRCIPQLHGAVKKQIKTGLETLEIELNSSVDNPLIFEEEDGAVALMGCNADGSYVGLAADAMVMAVTDLAKMSDRRIYRMLDHSLSGLPAFLNRDSAYSNGLMMIQYATAGLLGELRILSHPSTVDNVSTCAGQEDYVSMGYNASLKAYEAVRLARYILASELICGAQAADCYEDRPLAPATMAVYQKVREAMPELTQDAALEPYMEQVALQIQAGEYLEAVEGVAGELKF